MLLHLVLALLTAGRSDLPPQEQERCPALLAEWLAPADGLPEHRVILEIRMLGRTILVGDRAVSRRALRRLLSRSRAMEPAPFLIFDPSGTSDCAAATALRDLIDAGADCGRTSFCGQGARREWIVTPH